MNPPPYSSDCPFSVQDQTPITACNAQPVVNPPPVSTQSSVSIDRTATPLDAKFAVSFTGTVNAGNPRVIHGEVFTFVTVNGRKTLRVFPGRVTRNPQGMGYRPNVRVQLPPETKNTVCYKVLGYVAPSGAGGYTTLAFMPQ